MRKKIRESLFHSNENAPVVLDDEEGVVELPSNDLLVEENNFLIEDAIVKTEGVDTLYNDIKDLTSDLDEASAESIVGILGLKLRRLESLGVDTSTAQIALSVENFREGNLNISENISLAKDVVGTVVSSLEDHLIPLSTMNLHTFIENLVSVSDSSLQERLNDLKQFLEINCTETLSELPENTHLTKTVTEIDGKEVTTLSFQLNYHNESLDLFTIGNTLETKMVGLRSKTDEVTQYLTHVGSSVETLEVGLIESSATSTPKQTISNITIGSLSTAIKDLCENTQSLRGDMKYVLDIISGLSLKGVEVDSTGKTLLMGWYTEIKNMQSFISNIIDKLCLLVSSIYNN